MEIEAKFTIPDLQVFTELTNTSQLGDYSVGERTIRNLRDTYLDTDSRLLTEARWVCRRRQSSTGEVTLTVKGPGRSDGAVHRREEYEFVLREDTQPKDWPDGEARDHVLARTGSEALNQFLSLEQVRHVAPILRDGIEVAEISVDEVTVNASKHVDHYYELEIELKGEGSEADLSALANAVQQDWKLIPQPQSKFERALAFMNASSSRQP